MIQALAGEMKERGIRPELEAFDLGMINYALYLERKQLLSAPHYFNLLLGNIACAQADLLHAGLMVRDLPPGSYWSLAGIGDSQLTMNSIAIVAGGGVRVGLEDNLYLPDGELSKSNGESVAKAVELARLVGVEPASVAEAREILGIPG